MKSKLRMRIAIVVSHPIQHFCPQYASWAAVDGVQLKVFFGSALGANRYFDKDFKMEISWDNLYLDAFDHEFLNGVKVLPADKHLRADNLDKQLSAFAPMLLIHYGYFQPLSRDAYRWAVTNKVKLAYISDAEFRQHRPLWKRLLKYPFLFSYFKKIDYFFTVGNANEDYYKFYQVPASKFRRMHFPIDIKTYSLAWQQRSQLRQGLRLSLSIAETDLVLAVVGKLVSWKSQDHLIQLLINLELSSPEKRYHLLIAGSGEEEIKWKEKAAVLKYNRVSFLGFVKPTALPAIYAACDVYVHPALVEPHSLSVSEAIYMGCPVIVSDTSGSWGAEDDVQKAKNGFVYPHGKLEVLSKLIEEITVDGEVEKLGSYSHEIASKFQSLAHGTVLKKI